MSRVSIKKTIPERLEDYRLSLGLTWREVADRIELSVVTVMQIRSGLRNMGPLAESRLQRAEYAAKVELQARKVAEALIEGTGTARDLLRTLSEESGPVAVPLRFRRVTEAATLPTSVTLKAPTRGARERIITLFRKTLDPTIVILACIAAPHFDETYLSKLTPACLQKLQETAMTLMFGSHWRSIVVKMTLENQE